MRVLWEKGEASVGDVVTALKDRPRPAYNTVLTLLRILERKGYVKHRKDGRAFIFMALVDRVDASRSAVRTLMNRFFEGSPRLLVLNLLEDEQLSPEALQQLKERLEKVS